MRKYYLVQDLGNDNFKPIDSSFSIKTIKNKQELQKRIYKRDLKIISIEK